jgi:hypothetical protein
VFVASVWRSPSVLVAASFDNHQRRRIQGDLESRAGGVHPRVIDGHADCSHDGHSDDRHQWGYTAPGVLEKTGQHADHPTFVKTTYLQSSSIWGYPLEKA